MEKTLTTRECTEEVRLMARRTALLYYHFASTLIDELGEEEGRRLIAKAIWAYGEHCGRAVGEQVDRMGLPRSEENFNKVPDLPHFGWELSTASSPEGEIRQIATYCPLAAVWKELGPEAQALGRMYCYVDQAKQHAYNPQEDFIHTRNTLDGDPYCEFARQPHQGS